MDLSIVDHTKLKNFYVDSNSVVSIKFAGFNIKRHFKSFFEIDRA